MHWECHKIYRILTYAKDCRRHYDNIYKDFSHNGFTYNIYKWDIRYMILFTIRNKLIFK